jgi:hypothetical protein
MAVKNGRSDSYAKSWDMRASSERSGIIATEEGDFMPFELKSDDQLLLAGRLYRRSEETLEGVEKLPLRKKHVSPLGILMGHERLLRTPWTKVNPFDGDVVPSSITFLPEGRAKASYRGGSCVHEGTFTVKSKRLFIEWGNNPCADEARRPARSVTAEYPEWFRGELLMLDDAYRPESGAAMPPEALVGFRGMSSVLKGQFSQEPRKGVPLELRLTFESQFPLAQLEPGELWIWLRQAPSKEGEPRPRREQVLFSKDLRSMSLEQLGRQYAERVTVTPEFSGPAELEFELMFPKAADGWQKLMQRVYAVEVAE